MENDGFKICPFCKEKIRKEAVKCRFCGEWLEELPHPKTELVSQIEAPPPSQHVESNPKPSEDLVAQLAEKTNDQLLEMFRQPDDWLPETLNLARVELERRGLEPPKIAPGESQKQSASDSRKEKPSKFRFWLSIALLITCGVIWFAGLASVHWNGLSPGKQGETIANVTIGLFKVLFVAVVISRFEKRKGYRLLDFSVVCAICTAIGIYYFFDARHKAQEKAAESDRQCVSDLSAIQTFIKQGAVGDIPQFKLTGDPDNDAIFKVMNDFYQNYIQAYREAYSALQKLNEVDAFDDSLLTNKSNLELEIGKRTAGQQIIDTLATNTFSALASAGNEYESQNVSVESKQGVRKSFDQLTSQFKTMFASMIRQQKTDQDFLQFLDDNFSDFELKDGKILFSTNANIQKYADLAKNIQEATTEMQGLQTQAVAKVEAIKAKLQ